MLLFHSQLPASHAAGRPILQQFKAPALRSESKSRLNTLIFGLLFDALSAYFSYFQKLFVHASNLNYSLQSKQHIQNKETLANLHSHSVLQEPSFVNHFYIQYFARQTFIHLALSYINHFFV